MYGYGNSMFLSPALAGDSGPSVDPDAQAFITAASITDPTQQSAINTLVTGTYSHLRPITFRTSF